MTKDPKKKKHDETEDETQKKMLQEQDEFGLHEDVREKLTEEDTHKEPDYKATDEDK